MVAPLSPELLLAPPTPLTGSGPQKLPKPLPSLELAFALTPWVLLGLTSLHCYLLMQSPEWEA